MISRLQDIIWTNIDSFLLDPSEYISIKFYSNSPIFVQEIAFENIGLYFVKTSMH